MLKIYGTPMSRTYRTLWMALEAGIDFENIPTDFRTGDTQTPEFAAINPNRHIPAIVDGDLKLCESMAINLYIARKYAPRLAPSTIEEEALCNQWSIWAVTEAEVPIVTVLQHRALLPEDQRDEAVARKALAALPGPMKVLDDALEGHDWLIGDRVTVADINVASIVSTVGRIGFDTTPFPNVHAWLERCLSRPAAVEAGRMRQAAMDAAPA